MAVLVISLVISIFVAAIIFLKTKADKPRGGCNKNVPPSPRGLPLLGHLHLLGSLPHRSLRSVALAHGPVVLLRLGRVRAVVVSSAAAAEEVMKTRDLAFASRPASAMAQRLLYGRDVAFAPYGEYWRQTRRLCVAHLLSARRIQSFRGVREQEAQKLVGRIRRRSKSQQAMDLGELLVAYANGVVSRAAFGDDESWRGAEDDGDDVRKVLSDFQTLIGTEPVGEFLPWLGWVDTVTRTERKIKRTFQALDAVLEKVIDDHRRPGRQIQEEEDDRRDFVDVLLDVNKNEKEYGIRLETNEIKAIILDMFAAGTETTTTVMEWAVAELVTHPRAMRKLQHEIRGAVGTKLPQVTEDRLGNLTYLRAVVKETLRLHVPLPLLVPRAPPADAEVLGYRVPAGTRVVVNAWAIARDPATWGQDAEEFRPERFFLRSAGVDYRGQSFELLPFGAGRRGCPGVGFAEQSIELGLASLFYHFDWEAEAALDMTEKNGLAVTIKSGLPLRAKPAWVQSVKKS